MLFCQENPGQVLQGLLKQKPAITPGQPGVQSYGQGRFKNRKNVLKAGFF